MTGVFERAGSRARAAVARVRRVPEPPAPNEPAPKPKPPRELVWDEVTAHDWPGDRPVRAFFDLLLEAMGIAEQQKVLVAAAGQADVWRSFIEAAFPTASVVITADDADESTEHARLSALAPFDVVVHAADVDGVTQARTFQRIVWHLRAGGIYLTPRMVPVDRAALPPPPPPSVPYPNEDGLAEPPYAGDLWQLVAEAEQRRLEDFADDRPGVVPFRDLRGLGRHVCEIRVFSKMLWLRTERRTQAKLTEDEADAVLRARPEFGEEIADVPAATLHSTAPYVHNAGSDPFFTATMHSPRLRLRRYDRPVCSRGQIVTTGDFVWPDTFRHHLYPRLTNIYVEESAPRFGYVRRDISQPDDLPGAWFHLDNEWPGHYGHMLTDQLGRLWAWEEAKRREPEIKVLLTLQHDREPLVFHQWELDLFATFQITADDLQIFTAPCRPERLYSATSMFSLANYVHPDLARIWRATGDALAAQASDGARPRRLFCTRQTSLKRACHNTGDVEDLFRRHGFDVIDPSDYSLPDQVAMFRAAEAIAGFLGSALFTLAFCPDPTPVFAIGPSSYTARNENLICAVLGHPLVTAWSTPDIAHPEGGWTTPAFSSGFTVNLDDEGRFMEEQLRQLG